MNPVACRTINAVVNAALAVAIANLLVHAITKVKK